MHIPSKLSTQDLLFKQVLRVCNKTFAMIDRKHLQNYMNISDSKVDTLQKSIKYSYVASYFISPYYNY